MAAIRQIPCDIQGFYPEIIDQYKEFNIKYSYIKNNYRSLLKF